MQLATRTLLLCTLMLFAVPAPARGDPLHDIPLQWTPNTTLAEMGPVDISGPLLTTPIQIDAFTDLRQNPALIAENREDPAAPKTVTTSTSVAAFVTEHLKSSLRTAGLNVTDSQGAIHISGEIRQLFVTETDNYRGEVSLLIHVKTAAGKEIWTGISNGGAENFGRSYRADNYCETISNMLLRASYNLLANSGFHAALQSH